MEILTPQILVYNDLGVGSGSLLQLITALAYHFPNYRVEETNGSLIRDGHLGKNPALLCFGGGYDIGYLNSLCRAGFEEIRKYILGGGRYLGLCAGAYFGSGYCEFDLGGPLEVSGERYIKVFEGVASGPYYPGFVYETYAGSYAPRVFATDTRLPISSATIFYKGGCTFRGEQLRNVKVLYNYPNSTDPAIIASRLGTGWGILSGVHFEFDPDILQRDMEATPENLRIIDDIRSDDRNRVALLRTIIEALVNNDTSLLLSTTT